MIKATLKYHQLGVLGMLCLKLKLPHSGTCTAEDLKHRLVGFESQVKFLLIVVTQLLMLINLVTLTYSLPLTHIAITYIVVR